MVSEEEEKRKGRENSLIILLALSDEDHRNSVGKSRDRIRNDESSGVEQSTHDCGRKTRRDETSGSAQLVSGVSLDASLKVSTVSSYSLTAGKNIKQYCKLPIQALQGSIQKKESQFRTRTALL